MNVDTRNYSQEINNENLNNNPLSSEDYYTFETRQGQICKIQKEWDKESIFSQIESYNMVQELTLWKVEYCSKEWIEYMVKKWDTLTCYL